MCMDCVRMCVSDINIFFKWAGKEGRWEMLIVLVLSLLQFDKSWGKIHEHVYMLARKTRILDSVIFSFEWHIWEEIQKVCPRDDGLGHLLWRIKLRFAQGKVPIMCIMLQVPVFLFIIPKLIYWVISINQTLLKQREIKTRPVHKNLSVHWGREKVLACKPCSESWISSFGKRYSICFQMWLSRKEDEEGDVWCVNQATQAKEDHCKVNVMCKDME